MAYITPRVTRYQVSMAGNQNYNSGPFSKVPIDGSIPSGFATYNVSSNFGNGNSDPVIINKSGKITKMILSTTRCSTAVGTVGANPIVKIQVWDVQPTVGSSSVISTVIFPVTNVSIYNDFNSNNFQNIFVGGLNIAVIAGQCIGIVYFSETSTNEQIAALGGANICFEVQS